MHMQTKLRGKKSCMQTLAFYKLHDIEKTIKIDAKPLNLVQKIEYLSPLCC